MVDLMAIRSCFISQSIKRSCEECEVTCSSSWSAASWRETTLGSHRWRSLSSSRNLWCLACSTALATRRSTGSASLMVAVVASSHCCSSSMVWWNSPFWTQIVRMQTCEGHSVVLPPGEQFAAWSARGWPAHTLHPTSHWCLPASVSCHQPCSGWGCALPGGSPPHWCSWPHSCDCPGPGGTLCDPGSPPPAALCSVALPV